MEAPHTADDRIRFIHVRRGFMARADGVSAGALGVSLGEQQRSEKDVQDDVALIDQPPLRIPPVAELQRATAGTHRLPIERCGGCGAHSEDLARCRDRVAEALARGDQTYRRGGVTLVGGVVHEVDGAGAVVGSLGTTEGRPVGLMGCRGGATAGGRAGWERGG